MSKDLKDAKAFEKVIITVISRPDKTVQKGKVMKSPEKGFEKRL